MGNIFWDRPELGIVGDSAAVDPGVQFTCFVGIALGVFGNLGGGELDVVDDGVAGGVEAAQDAVAAKDVDTGTGVPAFEGVYYGAEGLWRLVLLSQTLTAC